MTTPPQNPPNPVPEPGRDAKSHYWDQYLRFRVESQGGDEALESIRRISREYDNFGSKVTNNLEAINKSLKIFSYGATGLFAGFGVAKFSSDISKVLPDLDKYNKAFVALRPSSASYGVGIDSIIRKTKQLGKEFSFTREESLSLSKSYIKGFNYAPPDKMIGFMRFLGKAAGENVEAMQELMSTMQQVGKQSPIFEQLSLRLQSNDKKTPVDAYVARMTKGLAFAKTVAGQMDIGTFKTVAGSIDTAKAGEEGINPADSRANDTLRKQMESVRILRKTSDDMEAMLANKFMPWLQTSAKYIDKWGDGFKNAIVQAETLSKYVFGITAAWGVAKTFNSVTNVFSGGRSIFNNTPKSKNSSIQENPMSTGVGVTGGLTGLATGMVRTPVPVVIVGYSGGAGRMGGGNSPLDYMGWGGNAEWRQVPASSKPNVLQRSAGPLRPYSLSGSGVAGGAVAAGEAAIGLEASMLARTGLGGF